MPRNPYKIANFTPFYALQHRHTTTHKVDIMTHHTPHHGLWLAILAGMLAFCMPAASQDLIITEIQVANNDLFIDNANCYGGWIEFYNTTDKAITLANRFLTDNPKQATRFKLPSGIGSVPAHGYKTIFFGHNSADGNYGTAANLQVDFTLDKDGGTIYLYGTATKLMCEQSYPPCIPRCSWAMVTSPDALSSSSQDASLPEWQWTDTPTPGAANEGSNFAAERLPAPTVSHEGGVFTEPFTLRVDIPEGARLLYTTNGSTPTLDNYKESRTGQFSVQAENSVFRFRLFQDGKLASPVVTRSFIYNTSLRYYLPVLSITTAPEHLFDNKLGVYVRGTNGISGNGQSSACNWNMDWERPVNMEYFTPETNDEGDISFIQRLNQECDFEVCGGWSRAWGGGTVDGYNWQTKSSFRLKTDKRYEGLNRFDYSFFPNKPYNRYRNLQFRNGGNDSYARIRDAALQMCFLSSGFYMDCQDVQPVHVLMNGQYLGMLNLRESNNKGYGESGYGIDTDEMDQFEVNGQVGYQQKVGDDVAMKRWIELAQKLADDPSNKAYYNEICRIVDIDEFCNYMAAECYIGCSDWLTNCNNVKGFRRRSTDGRFHLVMFDTDSSFSTGSMISSMKNRLNDSRYDTGKNYLIDIFYNMLQYEPFKQQFVTAFCLVHGSVLTPERCNAVIDDLAALMKPALSIEGNSPSGTANSLKSSISSYYKSGTNTMRNYFHLGSPYQMKLSSNIPAGRLLVNSQEVPTGCFDGQLYAPFTLSAQAPAGYVFRGWRMLSTDIVSNAIVPQGSPWHYYDQGSLDGTGWQQPDYEPADWAEGSAPFGYGNIGKNGGTPDYQTSLDYGSSSSNKRPTYYFRREFDIDAETLASAAEGLTDIKLRYWVDDGMRIYLNGTDIEGYHLNESPAYNDYTTAWEGNTAYAGSTALPTALLREGLNTLAVEVHNTSGSSSDIYWDAEISISEQSANWLGHSTSVELSEQLEPGTYELTAVWDSIREELPRIEAGATPLRINEVSATGTIFQNDLYKRSDWVEIYNATSVPQSLDGLYLSDKRKNPRKWQILASELQAQGGSELQAQGGGAALADKLLIMPGQTRIVWCDALQGVSQLHAPFKLDNADGSVVSLMAPDGSWQDVMEYREQSDFQTFALYPDGGLHEGLTWQPSIDAPNRIDSYLFTPNATSGTPWAPTDASITLAMEKGWNWTSHNLAENMAAQRFTTYADSLTSPTDTLCLLPADDQTLLTANNQTLLTADNQADALWEGSLDVLRPMQGYKVHMREAADITLRGLWFDTTTPQQLLAGTNWLACPLYNATVLTTALGQWQPQEGDAVIGFDAFATFEDGEWDGTLSTLHPGQAYALLTAADASFQWTALTQPEARSRRYRAPELDGPIEADTHADWNTAPRLHPSVMAVVAQLDADDMPQTNGMLGAFVDGQCRARTMADSEGRFLLTVHGRQGETVTFRYLTTAGVEYVAVTQATFQQETLLGSRREPTTVAFTQKEADGLSVAKQQDGQRPQYYDLGGRPATDATRGILVGPEGKRRSTGKP